MSVVLPVPPHRVIRAALFAVVCVGVAAVLHGAADGCQVSWQGIGIGVPGVWLVACAGLGRERSGPTLTAGLGAMQLGLHYLFAHVCITTSAAATLAVTAAPATTATPSMPMPGMPGMGMTPHAAAPGFNAFTMFCAHAIAVILCGWWLRQGERDFFALCRIVATLAATPLRRLTDAVALLGRLVLVGRYALPRILMLCFDGLKRRRTPVLTAVSFRGPPVLAVCA